jgi:hypothetical protein
VRELSEERLSDRTTLPSRTLVQQSSRPDETPIMNKMLTFSKGFDVRNDSDQARTPIPRNYLISQPKHFVNCGVPMWELVMALEHPEGRILYAEFFAQIWVCPAHNNGKSGLVVRNNFPARSRSGAGGRGSDWPGVEFYPPDRPAIHQHPTLCWEATRVAREDTPVRGDR